MQHCFSNFVIDESRGEVRAADRAVVPQRRVFGLLAYLARHADRIVGKEELLDAVWPGLIVTDNSVQRAVSVARAALRQLGCAGEIRTYVRRGYRLSAPVGGGWNGEIDSRAAARDAFSRGEWEVALAVFPRLDHAGFAPEDFQFWAHVAQCAGRPLSVLPALERMAAQPAATGDRTQAAWAAMMVAQLRIDWREPALAGGWLHRAARLIGSDRTARESGHLSVLQCRLALLQSNLADAILLADRARDIGRRCEDRDLESLGLLYGGEARLYDGAVDEGLAAIDEAGATVMDCTPRPWIGGLVYCGIIYSSLTRADWHRAAQWNEHFERWCALNACPGARGLCELHRAELLYVQGDLASAEREACRAQQTLAHRSPWAEGDAWRVLGEVHVARGDWAAASADFRKAHASGWNTELGRAVLAHAKGDDVQACRLLARALGDDHWTNRARRGMLLAHLAMFAAAAGSLAVAADALSEIDRKTELTATSALQGLVERARGDLALARGDCAAAIHGFRVALRTMRSIKAPLAAAQIQLRLAEALAREGDTESAHLESSTAATTLRAAEAFGLMPHIGETGPKRAPAGICPTEGGR